MLRTATYLKILMSFMALWMAGNVLFNLVVDPFSAWHWVYREGFNMVKTRVEKFERIATPLILERTQPRQVYLGTSRTESGIDGGTVTHDRYPPGSYINLGLRGGSIYEIMLLFQHALQVAPVQEAVVGLDLHAFSMPVEGKTEIDAYVAKDWQGDNNRAYRLRQFRDTLFAVDVTANSLATLERQSVDDEVMTEDGRYLAAKTLAGALPDRTAVTDYFTQCLAAYIESDWTPCPDGEVVFRSSERFDSFQRFRDILALAAANGVALRLYISPSHVTYLEAMRQSGVWTGSEQWKAELVRIIEAFNAEQDTDFSIIDFEGVDHFSTEAMPATDGAPMKWWFFDPVHFTPALGDAILKRLYSADDQPQWGSPLSSEMLEAHLRQLDEDLQRYFRDNPQDRKFVQQIVSQNRPLRKGASNCRQRL